MGMLFKNGNNENSFDDSMNNNDVDKGAVKVCALLGYKYSLCSIVLVLPGKPYSN